MSGKFHFLQTILVLNAGNPAYKALILTEVEYPITILSQKAYHLIKPINRHAVSFFDLSGNSKNHLN